MSRREFAAMLACYAILIVPTVVILGLTAWEWTK